MTLCTQDEISAQTKEIFAGAHGDTNNMQGMFAIDTVSSHQSISKLRRSFVREYQLAVPSAQGFHFMFMLSAEQYVEGFVKVKHARALSSHTIRDTHCRRAEYRFHGSDLFSDNAAYHPKYFDRVLRLIHRFFDPDVRVTIFALMDYSMNSRQHPCRGAVKLILCMLSNRSL